jgi:hypothetical protein
LNVANRIGEIVEPRQPAAEEFDDEFSKELATAAAGESVATAAADTQQDRALTPNPDELLNRLPDVSEVFVGFKSTSPYVDPGCGSGVIEITGDLLSEPLSALPFMCDHAIRARYHNCVGPPGVGKSASPLALLTAIKIERPDIIREQVLRHCGDVWILSAEDNLTTIKGRINALPNLHGITPEDWNRVAA